MVTSLQLLRKIKFWERLEENEDPMDSIKSRLDEVNLMVKPKAEWGNFIDTIDPDQRARILKYKDADYSSVRKRRRQHWRAINKFRDAVLKVLLLYRACAPRKKYLADAKEDASPGEIKKLKQQNVKQNTIAAKSSLGMDVQMAMMTQSEHRTRSDIRRITWVLRATKAFKHLFPAQLEEHLARVVSYERYDARRIVANQGRDPERFYYILTGKLQKVREYRLLSGAVTRNEGVIDKGCTTDPEEMTQNWPREYHLVTKGPVEVLILEKSDFLDLQHTCKGPPLDFLQQLDLFKEFPCEEFLKSPDSIDFRYYGQDNLLVKDTNRTPWLHVVKTGNVKVVRMQPVVNVQNESKFNSQSTQELGTTRSFSHASAMLGRLASQRKMKTIVGAISLPEDRLGLQRSKSELFWDKHFKHKAEPVSARSPFSAITRRHRPPNILVTTDNGGEEGQLLPTSGESSPRKKHKLSKSPLFDLSVNQNGTKNPRFGDITEESENGSASTKRTSFAINGVNGSGQEKSPARLSVDKSFFLPPINDPLKPDKPPEFHPHGTYLTREKTEFESLFDKKTKRESVQRTAYLQLDVLKPGDIFGLEDVSAQFKLMYPLKDGYEGLEHMDPQALASEGQGLTLISDGAEIIKISKRFFLTHAQNNTMLKVETMQREYMSTDEARTVMYNKETWGQYKSVLMDRTVNNRIRYKTETT